jgi:hypothetical protein
MSEPNTLKFPIQKIADVLLNENLSLYRRAIELYGFQALVLSPGYLHDGINAKIFAAVKILEMFDEGMPEDTAIREKLETPHYEEVLEVALFWGWRRFRSIGTAREFADDLDRRKEESLAVAQMAEFSYRFAKFGSSERKLGGSTMAREFLVRRNRRKQVRYSDGTLKTRWSEYKDSGVLLYLLHMHMSDLFPPRLTRKQFVKQLLLQAGDVGKLHFLLAAYRDVSHLLRPRG